MHSWRAASPRPSLLRQGAQRAPTMATDRRVKAPRDGSRTSAPGREPAAGCARRRDGWRRSLGLALMFAQLVALAGTPPETWEDAAGEEGWNDAVLAHDKGLAPEERFTAVALLSPFFERLGDAPEGADNGTMREVELRVQFVGCAPPLRAPRAVHPPSTALRRMPGCDRLGADAPRLRRAPCGRGCQLLPVSPDEDPARLRGVLSRPRPHPDRPAACSPGAQPAAAPARRARRACPAPSRGVQGRLPGTDPSLAAQGRPAQPDLAQRDLARGPLDPSGDAPRRGRPSCAAPGAQLRAPALDGARALFAA